MSNDVGVKDWEEDESGLDLHPVRSDSSEVSWNAFRKVKRSLNKDFSRLEREWVKKHIIMLNMA